MTGDPLDRAREAIEDAMDAGGDFLNEPVGKAGIAALDALVEVARAARDLDNALRVTAPKSAQPWLRKLVPLKNFRAALARLDGPR